MTEHDTDLGAQTLARLIAEDRETAATDQVEPFGEPVPDARLESDVAAAAAAADDALLLALASIRALAHAPAPAPSAELAALMAALERKAKRSRGRTARHRTGRRHRDSRHRCICRGRG
jgi:hypothetical protein